MNARKYWWIENPPFTGDVIDMAKFMVITRGMPALTAMKSSIQTNLVIKIMHYKTERGVLLFLLSIFLLPYLLFLLGPVPDMLVDTLFTLWGVFMGILLALQVEKYRTIRNELDQFVNRNLGQMFGIVIFPFRLDMKVVQHVIKKSKKPNQIYKVQKDWKHPSLDGLSEEEILLLLIGAKIKD